ncbi:MAG: deoxyguanosinetriphosphate triphosphohydrolase [Hyphomicrobiales bacterium]|uniref:deoxyguanosinetriphosphate triphosphohydrolase n=1 Tax=Rhabdaerophilum calidifontis TaxID=2604328 RepID=UPI00123C06A3|nr:deoxyguanosinetriphosphate triphosphohydrolase [Rhabdaerophilum calidifontis]MCA1953096.1 deoxyguanosinetriphosphate triphosphohydrolase [Hyphomicrobiales bacterium]MCA1998522.1 deoxyguanosinetriphosphate triphosphohydrolase [Hyphomicrobiales bacterium]
MLFHRERPLSPFAVDHRRSRGRLIPEPPSPTRTVFQRDRDRILHSNAFRRLKHKTQVFVEHEGDHYRTRLTHTLEVAQIARSISRILGLDEDLAEALALAHDLGHPPFGHAGEDALDRLMAAEGGFDHNAQALRIVTRLERRYAAYDGLNLTWETLEGLVKHNGPLLDAAGAPAGRYRKSGVPSSIIDFDQKYPLDISSFASAEAQVAALADDIAYNAHDIDDGLRAGLFPAKDLRDVPFLAAILYEIDRLHPDLDEGRRGHEIMRRVITRLVEDVASESERRLVALAPLSAEDIRAAGAPVIAFSASMAEGEAALKDFLFTRMYRHPRVNRLREAAARIIEDLFRRFLAEPAEMGEDHPDAGHNDPARLPRRVADHIAGMTDRFAIQEHGRLFDQTPALR